MCPCWSPLPGDGQGPARREVHPGGPEKLPGRFTRTEPPSRWVRGAVLREGKDAVIVACGILVHEALQAAKKLAEEGIDAAVIDPVTVKPLDTQLIRTYAARTGVLVTAENHNKIGGLYSAVKECLDGEAKVGYVAVEDTFGEVGPQDYLRTRFDLTDDHIVRVVKRNYEKAGK